VIVRVAYTSILATVVVSCVFSFAAVSLIRASELRRANRSGRAAAYTVAALCGLAACAAAVVYGLILVGQKS
jgi:hypothetical protein